MSATAVPPLVTWTGRLFVIGSVLFMLGVPLSQVPALPPLVSALTFAVGAVFFTAAATCQLLLARRELPASARHLITFWRGRTSDWVSAAVQLAGTVMFNVNTIHAAVLIGADPTVLDRAVWRPDAVGSVLFLVSGLVAMAPEVRERRHAHVSLRSATIAWLNLAGSILFGASAIGAYVIVDTGRQVSLVWSNVGTFWGAACFAFAAVLFGRPDPAAPPVAPRPEPTRRRETRP
ncbi:MAG: hypothetical protein KJ792_13825 [Actinobacteria bacterium]|nr:hypothetical protein [Actinomycetota bacterium]MCG2801016.1 hypothetical protein [Cellulomonas sp.]